MLHYAGLNCHVEVGFSLRLSDSLENRKYLISDINCELAESFVIKQPTDLYFSSPYGRVILSFWFKNSQDLH